MAPKRRLKKGADQEILANPGGANPSSQPQKVPIEIQQRILNVFKDACSDSLNDSLAGTIQEIKQHLFNRDFVGAFGNPAYLEAYAARWSPTRALTYLDILCNLPAVSVKLVEGTRVRLEGSDLVKNARKLSIDNENPTVLDAASQCQRVVCIGAGGGAELVALAGAWRQLQTQSVVDQYVSKLQESSAATLGCVFVDIADWSPVLQKLHSSAIVPIPVPRNASVEREPINVPLVTASEFPVRVVQQDILKVSQGDLGAIMGDATLVTIMFTLNELYSTSIASTTRMLLSLTSLLEQGTLLLVVDSPGSYSTVSLGKSTNTNEDLAAGTKSNQTSKEYPMQWLLDHTLLETATTSDSQMRSRKRWEKLESQESKWFRLSSQLRYPLDLEDMRYQMHLYQRL